MLPYRFSPNVKTCPKSEDNDNFGHPLTLGASSDAFFVMSAEKLAILAGPILASLPVRVKLVTTTTHNTQHTTTKMSHRHPTLHWLCHLSPWAGFWHHQPMALRLPMVPCKAPMVGFGGVMAGLPVWGAKWNHTKNIEEYGALALGGHYLAATHNNQPIVGRSGRGYVGEEARGVSSVWEDVIASIWVAIWTMKK
jgi:hypothetical protein